MSFYAPTPLGSYGFTPERFAADDLSSLLVKAADGRFTLVPRASMERAEASLRWQSTDVLSFDRLRALAQAVGADALVTGWIPLLVVNDFGGAQPGAWANTNLVLQVFDPRQDRFLTETRPSAYVTAGISRDLLTEQTLHDALLRAVPPLAGVLTTASP